ncbi:hypothetical protein BDQ94DRAFT_140189 [Aspergillus welwitschiae]|uniref:Uncharacterized protein n=1 Tax=Aspergillus welwitschiae TaxID=1341132 RepID=A0A3F3Q7I7_9EURO|nr:hypothetical protein BDQ94DRAFT_140189 [Aspergillus welwitschiae]RDH35079.1 hypothetical protein BDQ94DRAFT_140189 [Aspergillus welwitschiae]
MGMDRMDTYRIWAAFWLGVGVGSWRIWIYGVSTYLWLLVCWYGMGAESVQSL